MPGPADALERFVGSVREGLCGLLTVPASPKYDWISVVTGHDPRLRWHELSPDLLQHADPNATIGTALLPAGCITPESAAETARHDGMRTGNRVLIDGSGLEGWAGWSQWKDFLINWSRASRAVPVEERTTLSLVLPAALAKPLLYGSPDLHVQSWRGTATHLDFRLYSAHRLRFRPWTEIERELAAAVIAATAAPAPDVVEELTQAELDDALWPFDFLRRLAEGRGRFGGTDEDSTHRWEEGRSDTVSRLEYMNPVYLAAAGTSSDIDRRIWRGQVGVLLPLVEERRMELLEILGPQLRVPFVTKHATVTDRKALELNHIAEQVRLYRLRLPLRQNKTLEPFAKIRNKLAHLEPVVLSLLREADIVTTAEFGTQ